MMENRIIKQFLSRLHLDRVDICGQWKWGVMGEKQLMRLTW